jgi:nucleotide-binding universal stress UspA family protein
MFERILVPLDGSARAEEVLAYLRPILKRCDAELVLAMALEKAAPAAHERLEPLEPDEAGERRQALDYLDGVEARLADEGVRARSLECDGPAADAVLSLAESEGATLIAMTTHGRTGLARWVFGSVAEKVLRASEVPVLVVRSFGSERTEAEGEPAERRGPEVFRRILVPSDGSESSLEVVPHAAELARLCGAEVVAVSVAAPSLPAVAARYAGPVDRRHPELLEGARAAQLAASRFAAAGARASTIVAHGDPAAEIVDASRRQGFDLIAMATHGRSGVSRWVLGSVTEKVLRAASVPMLVVRSRRPGDYATGFPGR